MIFVWRNKSKLIDNSQGQVELQEKPATNKLSAPDVKNEFNIELRNCFSALRIEDGKTYDPVETTWSNILRVYNETAESILGFTKKDIQWITSDTWMKINERRKAKDNQLRGKSPRLIQSPCNRSIYM